jgi:hypothetical protein
MTNSIRTKIAASALTLAAAAIIAVGAGAGTATAGAPTPLPAGTAVGPFASPEDCRAAFNRPWIPKTDCFYTVSPAGWYFVGGIGA